MGLAGNCQKKRLDIEEFARSPEGTELSTLCIDLGYKLADTVQNLTRDQINFLMASLNFRNETAEVAELAQKGITKIFFRNPE